MLVFFCIKRMKITFLAYVMHNSMAWDFSGFLRALALIAVNKDSKIPLIFIYLFFIFFFIIFVNNNLLTIYCGLSCFRCNMTILRCIFLI
jgi:hypothetical protein